MAGTLCVNRNSESGSGLSDSLTWLDNRLWAFSPNTPPPRPGTASPVEAGEERAGQGAGGLPSAPRQGSVTRGQWTRAFLALGGLLCTRGLLRLSVCFILMFELHLLRQTPRRNGACLALGRWVDSGWRKQNRRETVGRPVVSS